MEKMASKRSTSCWGPAASGWLWCISLGSGPAAALARTDQMWPRLAQRSEKSGTTVLIITDRPVAGSFAAVTLNCDEGQGIWERAPGGRLRLHSQRTRIEVRRSRLGPPGDAELLTLRK